MDEKVVPLFKNLDIAPKTVEQYKDVYKAQKINVVIEASQDMMEEIIRSFNALGFYLQEEDVLFIREALAASLLRIYRIEHSFHALAVKFVEQLNISQEKKDPNAPN